MQRRGNELQNAKKKRIAAAIGVAALIVFLVLFYILVGMAIVNLLEDPRGFKTWIDGFDTSSIFIFIGLRVIMTVLRVIPGGPLQVAGRLRVRHVVGCGVVHGRLADRHADYFFTGQKVRHKAGGAVCFAGKNALGSDAER